MDKEGAMGQDAFALMYGVRMDDAALKLAEDLDESFSILDEYETTGGVVPSRTEEFVGFFIAGGEEEDVPELRSFCVDDVRKVYAKSYKTAVERWTHFIVWADKLGIQLPMPGLYLVKTEVA